MSGRKTPFCTAAIAARYSRRSTGYSFRAESSCSRTRCRPRTARQGVLQPVYDRLELNSLGSPGWYTEQLEQLGFERRSFTPLVEHLRTHYNTVRSNLASRQDEFTGVISDEYINRMLTGLETGLTCRQRLPRLGHPALPQKQ
ncbi:MAG: hypothetical protein U5O39_08120 [Gammaproteobacteria bacterium]|nr:hypothetical protein [Gammaproteobacteria bacterium]